MKFLNWDLVRGNSVLNRGGRRFQRTDADRMIRAALDSGINFYDTAPNYGHGTSEERLGKVFKTLDRETIVVNTKFGRLDNGTVDFNAAQIRGSIERSLKRLQIDCIDSAIIHSPPRELLDGNKVDHYEILERLQDEGKIRAYGASVDFAVEIETLLETTNAKVFQCFFNILHQDAKHAFDTVQAHGATVIAKIPFDSGWLTGKYHSESIPGRSRAVVSRRHSYPRPLGRPREGISWRGCAVDGSGLVVLYGIRCVQHGDSGRRFRGATPGKHRVDAARPRCQYEGCPRGLL